MGWKIWSHLAVGIRKFLEVDLEISKVRHIPSTFLLTAILHNIRLLVVHCSDLTHSLSHYDSAPLCLNPHKSRPSILFYGDWFKNLSTNEFGLPVPLSFMNDPLGRRWPCLQLDKNSPAKSSLYHIKT